jgi:patatin-like phospholipase/acyl hydrolase
MEKKAVVQAFEDEQAPKEFEERWNRKAPLTIESFRKQFNMEL